MNFSDPKFLMVLALGVVLGAGLLIAAVRNITYAGLILSLMIFIAALAPQANLRLEGGFTNNVWLRPLQEQRGPAYTAVGALLTLAVLAHAGRLGARLISAPVIVLTIINVYASMLDMHHAALQAGMERLGLIAFSMPAMILVVGGMIHGWDDHLKIARCLGVAGVFWAGGVAIQVMLAPGELVVKGGNRFTGLLGNPQATAVYLGPQFLFLAFLAFNETNRRLRLLWIVTTGVTLIFIAWTGSRTCLILSTIGATAVLYTRLGRAVFLLPLLVAGFLGLVQLAVSMGIDLPLDRVVSLQDTRSEVWWTLLEDAVGSPLFGAGGAGARAVENSYLLGWAVYGPIMLLLILVLGAVSLFQAVRLRMVRRDTPPMIQRWIDVLCAFFFIYFLGAMFEWYILARVDANVVFMFVTSLSASSIIHQARAERQGDAQDHGQIEHDHYGAPASAYAHYGEGSGES